MSADLQQLETQRRLEVENEEQLIQKSIEPNESVMQNVEQKVEKYKKKSRSTKAHEWLKDETHESEQTVLPPQPPAITNVEPDLTEDETSLVEEEAVFLPEEETTLNDEQTVLPEDETPISEEQPSIFLEDEPALTDRASGFDRRRNAHIGRTTQHFSGR